MNRKFELKLSYHSEGDFEVQAFDVIQADSFVSLLAQFMVLIGSVHQRILQEEAAQHRGMNDDIPF